MATVGVQLRTILLATRDRLRSNLLMPVNVALRMNVPCHDDLDYLILLPLMQIHEQDSVTGNGRRGTVVAGRANVYFRHADATDQQYYDDSFLMADGGFLDVLAQVEDLLDLWLPLNADGSPMLAEPMRAVFANEPRKEYDSPERGEGMVELEIKYVAWRRGV